MSLAPGYLQRWATHTREAQSALSEQTLPARQRGEHSGRTHTPSSQTREAQSLLSPQGPPTAHVGAHDAGAHRLPVQTKDAQSPLLPHTAPVLQDGEHAGSWQVPLSLHTPEPHSASAPQGAPSWHAGAQLAGWQAPPAHTKEWQSPLSSHGAPVSPGTAAQLAQVASASRIGWRNGSAWLAKKVLAVSFSFVPLLMNSPQTYS